MDLEHSENPNSLQVAPVDRDRQLIASRPSEQNVAEQSLQFSLAGGNFQGATIGPHNYELTRQDGIIGCDLQNPNFGTQNIQNIHHHFHVPQQSASAGSENKSSSSEEDDTDGCIHLTTFIKMFHKKPLSKYGNVFEGERVTNVLERELIAVKYHPYDKRNAKEAKILQKLSHHKNVVSIIHADTCREGRLKYMYIAMERCHTENLSDFIKQNVAKGIPLNWRKALLQAKQVTKGLDFIHENDIIHRDLKPDNVLLSMDQLVLKIGDFGLSKELRKGRSVTAQSTLRVGTDGYRAPETYNSDVISREADLFSLGLVIFFIWSNGKHPFGEDADYWNGNIKRNKNRDLGRLLIYTDAARGLIEELLEYEPKLRPSAAQILQSIAMLLQQAAAEASSSGPAETRNPSKVFQFKPEVDENIINFIRQSRKHYRKLKAALRGIAVLDGNASSVDNPASFSFAPCKDIDIKSQKKFEDECRKRFGEFLSEYSHKNQRFDRKKLAEARSLNIYQQIERNYEGEEDNQDVIVCWNNDEVNVTGLRAAVEHMAEHISKCADCTVKKMDLNADKYSIMTCCGVVEEVRAKHKNVQVRCDDKASQILLSGNEDDVSDAQIDALTMMQNVVTKKITGMDESIVRFLAETFKDTDGVKTILQQTVKGRNIKACVTLDGEEPCIKVRVESGHQMALSIIKELITTESIPTDEPTSAVVNSRAWKDFEQTLQGTKAVKVYIKPNDSILMVGLVAALRSLRKRIEDFLEENVIKRAVVRMAYGNAKFVVEKSKKFTTEECERKSIKCGLTSDNGGGVFIEGRQQSLDDAVKTMSSLRRNIIETKHTLHDPRIKEYYNGKEGKDFLSATERVNHCIILAGTKDCEDWKRASRQQGQSQIFATKQKSNTKGKVTSVKLENSGTSLQVWKTDIIQHKCDVIVNASNTQLRLLPGGVSGFIIKMDTEGGGGSKIQKELDAIIQKNHGDVLPGDAVTTSAGSLPACKKIVHAVGPRWNSMTEKSDPELVLKACILRSLEEVEKYGLSSIAIPAISCGVFGGKVAVCVPLILETVTEYFKEVRNSSIKKVDFVELGRQDVIDEFAKHVNKLQSEHQQQPTPTTPRQSPRTPPSTSSNIAVTLQQGDIMNQSADVIVNITSPQGDPNMQESAVSKALLRKGGQRLLQECAQIQGPHNLGCVFETSGGNLSCQRLYHGVVSNYNQNSSESLIRGIVKKCLQMADQSGYRSIVFPAIATGGFQHPTQLVAQWMRGEILTFQPNNLQNVTILLFPGNVQAIQDFTAEFSSKSMPQASAMSRQMTQRSKSLHQRINSTSILDSQTGFFTKLLDFGKDMAGFFTSSSHNEAEDASLDIFFYSTNDEDINQAIKCVSDETKKVVQTMVIKDDAFGRLTEWEQWEIREIGIQYSVKIHDHSNRYIKQFKLEGLTSKVMKAHEAIKDILKDFCAAETTALFVTWQKMESGSWANFPPRAIHILEKAYKARNGDNKTPKLNQIRVPEYNQGIVTEQTIDLSNLENNQWGGNPPRVRRLVKEKAADEISSHWADMKGKQIQQIPLSSSSPEYQKVLTQFQMNGVFHSRIILIERIQNTSLYKQYVAKKTEVTNKLANGGKTISRQLFHGTSDENKIITQGFDRSFAGKNATAYGRGVYFTVGANYSHCYTVPNNQQNRRMFLADVITGEYCQGNSGYVYPPPRPNSTLKNDLHDSAVDNVNTPGIFVIFKDASAYPTYLITYQ